MQAGGWRSKPKPEEELRPKKIYSAGSEALKRLYKEMLDAHAAGEEPLLRELGPLKTYGWLLDDTEFANVKNGSQLRASGSSVPRASP